jgi:hypothetical protein
MKIFFSNEYKSVNSLAFFLIVSLLFLSNIQISLAQKVSIDKKEIFIGEQVKIDLSIDLSLGQSVVFPQIGDTLSSKVEVLEKSAVIDEKDNAGKITRKKQTIFITAFDSGFYAISPFKFLVNGNPVLTEPFLLTVKNVAVDTTKGINDIKQNLEESFNLMDYLKVYWPYFAGGVALFAIIFYLIYYFVLREKKPKVVQEKPKLILSLDIITIEALENLRAKNLHKTPEQLKEFHTELTDILRNYIEQRFSVNAMEKTSDELMHGLRLTEVNAESKNKLRRVLILADLVKFAKEKPMIDESEKSIDLAISFVKENTLADAQIKTERKALTNVE